MFNISKIFKSLETILTRKKTQKNYPKSALIGTVISMHQIITVSAKSVLQRMQANMNYGLALSQKCSYCSQKQDADQGEMV